MSGTGLRVGLDELVPVKQATRELPRLLARIRGGAEHVVLTRRGVPVGVLLSIDRYEELLRRGRA